MALVADDNRALGSAAGLKREAAFLIEKKRGLIK
jgi:hypothetical protein